jgi:hypothetical protein
VQSARKEFVANWVLAVYPFLASVDSQMRGKGTHLNECPIAPITYTKLLKVSKEYMARRRRGRPGIPYQGALPQLEQAIPQSDYSAIAGTVGDFLMNWNQGFYISKTNIDYKKIEECIRNTFGRLLSYRGRTILSFDGENEAEKEQIGLLFRLFLDATYRVRDNAQGPVSTAKALHIFAPDFFAPWDNDVALKYHCSWGMPGLSAICYLSFMKNIQQCCMLILQSYISEKGGDDKEALSAISQEASHWHSYHPSLLKLIDEYNMAQYSNWR